MRARLAIFQVHGTFKGAPRASSSTSQEHAADEAEPPPDAVSLQIHDEELRQSAADASTLAAAAWQPVSQPGSSSGHPGREDVEITAQALKPPSLRIRRANQSKQRDDSGSEAAVWRQWRRGLHDRWAPAEGIAACCGTCVLVSVPRQSGKSFVRGP